MDIFISHSSKDKPIAEAICHNVEAVGIRCWIAPRDVPIGETFPEAIMNVLPYCRIMVLVFSNNAQISMMVKRELSIAGKYELIIIPFRIEDIEPEGLFEFYLTIEQWLDAMSPPMKNHIEQLVRKVQTKLSVVPKKPLQERVKEKPLDLKFDARGNYQKINELLKDVNSKENAIIGKFDLQKLNLACINLMNIMPISFDLFTPQKLVEMITKLNIEDQKQIREFIAFSYNQTFTKDGSLKGHAAFGFAGAILTSKIEADFPGLLGEAASAVTSLFGSLEAEPNYEAQETILYTIWKKCGM